MAKPIDDAGGEETLSTTKHLELYQANAVAMPPAPPKPLSLWARLFGPRWSEPEFVQTVGFKYRHIGITNWEPTTGSLYRRTHRDGTHDYFIRGGGSVLSIDASAWENGRHLVFT